MSVCSEHTKLIQERQEKSDIISQQDERIARQQATIGSTRDQVAEQARRIALSEGRLAQVRQEVDLQLQDMVENTE